MIESEKIYGARTVVLDPATVTETDVNISIFDLNGNFIVSNLLRADEYTYGAGGTTIDLNLNLHMSRYTNLEIPNGNYDIKITFQKNTNDDIFIKEISPSKSEIRVGLDAESDDQWNLMVRNSDTLLENFDRVISISGKHYRLINVVADYSLVEPKLDALNEELVTNNERLLFFEGELAKDLPGDIISELTSERSRTEIRNAQIEEDISNILQYATLIFKLDSAYSGPTIVPINEAYIYEEQFISRVYENVYVYAETEVSEILIDINNSAIRDEDSTTTNWFNFEELVGNDSGSFEQAISSSLVNGVKNLNIDFSDFDNHVYFGLAENKFLNAYKNVRNIELYNEIIEAFPTSSDGLISSQSYSNKITQIKNDFNQYERYMYEKSSSYAWPKQSSGSNAALYSYSSSQVQAWSEEQINSGSNFDKNNKYSLLKNMPETIVLEDNDLYLRFLLGAWGDFFDYIKSYIEQFQYLYTFDYDKVNSVPDELIHLYGSLFNVELNEGFDNSELTSFLDGYGQVSGSTPLENITKEKWTRLFSCMPYLNKIRGTNRSIDAVLNIYGIPKSILTIMEHGGTQTSGSDYIEEEVNGYALNFFGGETIEVQNANYAQLSGSDFTIEMRYATTSSGDHILFGNTGFNVALEDNGDSDNYGSLVCTISGSKTIWNASGSDAVPYYNGDWFNIILQRSGSELYLKTKYFKEDQMFYDLAQSASLNAVSQSYLDAGAFAGNVLFFGGDTNLGSFSGSMQEIRLWNISLSEPALTQHAYDFRSIAMRNPFEIDDSLVAQYKLNDNNSGSTANDYSYPPILDVTLNNFTGNQYYNFTKSTKTNLNYFMASKYTSNKINIGKPSQSQEENSNVVDILFSPVKAINEDIINDFALYDFNDAIGDPIDMYNDDYGDLTKWRNFYFRKLPNNYDFYSYMKFIRNFDQSIMSIVKTVVPARVKLWSGILIEQPILERSKYRWERSQISSSNFSASVDVREVVSETGSKDSILTASIDLVNETQITGSNNTNIGSTIIIDVSGSQPVNNSFYKSISSVTDSQYLTVFELMKKATYEGTQLTSANNYDGSPIQVSQSSGAIIRVK